MKTNESLSNIKENKDNMNIKDKRLERDKRMKSLYERLTNMPEIDGKRVHGEVDAVVVDAIDSSEERDKKVKDAFKDKNKEVREFIKAQDKATGVTDEEYKSERRLFLDEDLFDDPKESDTVKLKESKQEKKSKRKPLKEAKPYDPADYNAPQEELDPKRFIDAVDHLVNAFYEVQDLIDLYGIDVQDWFTEGYPFEKSYDEQAFAVADWRDSMEEYFED